ncbi:hypothetical protein SARC_05620 [Sphaeroforma arctica JP610]|uniref:Transmembrane 9 superfamily member n=1 Tax=Sphaeroforma arctica JP610 TaxID=667725 RepID=A0A0L0FZV8_9EUKA|nr:hypothetical protein SARC_05620 [Sphaeroforma arctica JP610]KNC82091.1 hypothetical protein SARC_05620 [Sphaeroforma arctica JP610]|eukprot:XP_014155993.1 hypothetical protein SARC_05620 [Sphaeroforma arctica JP610]
MMKIYSSLLLLGAVAQADAIINSGFSKGDTVTVWSSKMASPKTAVPYPYYHYDFCGKDEGFQTQPENLGQRLLGDDYESIGYPIKFMEDTECAAVCTKKYDFSNKKDHGKIKELTKAIKKSYMHHWLVDNLDVILSTIQGETYVPHSMGHPVGARQQNGDKHEDFIYNHIDFTFYYNDIESTVDQYLSQNTGKKFGIVGVNVGVKSQHSCAQPDYSKSIELNEKVRQLEIPYTYSVKFVPTSTKWASRWDAYLQVEDASIRWLSIAISMAIVVLLSGLVAMILFRTVYRDITRYNLASGESEDVIEEYGWKLLHGDVFRRPAHGMWLSVLVGSGVQMVTAVGIALCFAFLHIYSPTRRGSALTGAVTSFVLLGFPAGYTSARLYVSFGGERWKTNCLLTAFFCPGVAFVVFAALNIVAAVYGSSNAVPFTSILCLLAMWFLISVPLCFLGAYLGFKKSAIEFPMKANPIPRQIPFQSSCGGHISPMLLGGLVPFAAIFVELFFFLNSFWNHRLYFLPAFLFIVYAILLVISAQVSILTVYTQLCVEDYRWWWRSFIAAGSTAIYFAIYSYFYFFTTLKFVDPVSILMFTGFTVLCSLAIMIMCGSIGFLAGLWFVRTIYSSVKLE